MYQKKIFLFDELLSQQECKIAIDYYNIKGPTGKHRDVFPMNIVMSDTCLIPLTTRIEETARSLFNNIVIDWIEIVKWPVGSYQQPHRDDATNRNVLTSITYLNEGYEGGETYFYKDIKIIPKTGRTIFFDGMNYIHGVTQVKNLTRYVIAAWYKDLKNVDL